MKGKINILQTVDEGCYSLTLPVNELHGNGEDRTAFFNRAEFIELAGAMESATWTEKEAVDMLPLEDVQPSTWLPTLIFLGLALGAAVIGVMIGMEVAG